MNDKLSDDEIDKRSAATLRRLLTMPPSPKKKEPTAEKKGKPKRATFRNASPPRSDADA